MAASFVFIDPGIYLAPKAEADVGLFVLQSNIAPTLPFHTNERLYACSMDRYGHLFPRGDDAKELDAAELALVNA